MASFLAAAPVVIASLSYVSLPPSKAIVRAARLTEVTGVPVAAVDEDRVAFVLAQQVALGQRGTLVRAFRLVAEEHDLVVEPLGAERLGRFGACQPAAYDHESRHCRLQRVNPSRRCRR
jgi:hypothetical protein